MQIVNIHQAKTNFSKLIEAAMKGEEIIIAKAGKAVVKLVPITKPKRRPGLLKGKIEIADDFDEPIQDIIDAFEGKYDHFDWGNLQEKKGGKE